MNKLKKLSVFVGLMLLLYAIGCDTYNADAMAKYTDEQALAIVEAGWKIGGSIVIAAIIRALFNKRV